MYDILSKRHFCYVSKPQEALLLFRIDATQKVKQNNNGFV